MLQGGADCNMQSLDTKGGPFMHQILDDTQMSIGVNNFLKNPMQANEQPL